MQGGWIRRVSSSKGATWLLRMAHQRRLVSRLRAIPMLEPLSQRQLERLSKGMGRAGWPAGECIFSRSDEGMPLYFVTSGKVEITLYHDEHQPDDVPASPCSPGGVSTFHASKDCVFGDVALLTGRSLASRAVAISRVRALRLDPADIDRALRGGGTRLGFLSRTPPASPTRPPPRPSPKGDTDATTVSRLRARFGEDDEGSPAPPPPLSPGAIEAGISPKLAEVELGAAKVLGSNIHNEGISPKLKEVELGTPPRGWDTSAAKVLGSNIHNEMHDSS